MVFEHIEKLKQEYTDKYVVVDDQLPELRRFKGLTGTVRTVNMNGQALVEFAGHNNIGWYDIDIDYLRVIDQPLAPSDGKAAAKSAAKPAAAGKAAKKTPSDLEKARAASRGQPAGEMSVSDVLAAARSGQGGGARPATPKAAESMSVEEMLAAARAEPQGAAGTTAASGGGDEKASLQQQLEAARKPSVQAVAATPPPPATAADPRKMSVEEMLAAARAEKGGAPPAPPAAESPAAESPAAESPAVESPAAESPVAEAEPRSAEPPAGPDATGTVGSKMDEITGIDEQLAYCRRVDGS